MLTLSLIYFRAYVKVGMLLHQKDIRSYGTINHPSLCFRLLIMIKQKSIEQSSLSRIFATQKANELEQDSGYFHGRRPLFSNHGLGQSAEK